MEIYSLDIRDPVARFEKAARGFGFNTAYTKDVIYQITDILEDSEGTFEYFIDKLPNRTRMDELSVQRVTDWNVLGLLIGELAREIKLAMMRTGTCANKDGFIREFYPMHDYQAGWLMVSPGE